MKNIPNLIGESNPPYNRILSILLPKNNPFVTGLFKKIFKNLFDIL